jgi:AraC-like DNA-binding protein
MPSRSAVRLVVEPRDVVVPLGLSSEELVLVRTAVAGRFSIMTPQQGRPVMVQDATRHNVVHVTAFSWWDATVAQPDHARVLATARMVLLLPADTSAEQQRRIARIAPRALLVITGETYSALALHDALEAIRHHKVADALVPRISEDPGSNDLATRALLEAVRLLPGERNVPALARALFLSERTLRRQLRVVCPLLTPRRTLSWACLLHAAWYLGETSDAFDHVARQVGASDAANLYRQLRRHLGLTSRDLRTSGAHPVDLTVRSWRDERDGRSA